MQHSIKYVGSNYEKISMMRADKNPFNASNFFQFTKNNITKYNIVVLGDDLLVGTWYFDKLINDYRQTLKQEIAQ
jgi:hypothetical protein